MHVRVLDYRGCARGAVVRRVEIVGGRHEWPGAPAFGPAPQAAARFVWAFAAARRTPG